MTEIMRLFERKWDVIMLGMFVTLGMGAVAGSNSGGNMDTVSFFFLVLGSTKHGCILGLQPDDFFFKFFPPRFMVLDI